MCGICGIVGDTDEALIREMCRRMAHRGPDDEGVYVDETPTGKVGLGHRRLSIIDTSPGGHEPMADQSGRAILTFNGEIYNFLEIRSQLEKSGHAFKSDSDAEVLLRSYLEWGPGCLSRLNGMFAFAIWDRGEQTLFAARDRLGIKPFYYCRTPARFAFASEIKALLSLPDLKPEVDLSALDQFMTFLWAPEPHSLFKGVMKLPAGHYLVYRDGCCQITQYWDVKFAEDDRTSERDWVEILRAQILKSVKMQLVSDVPLGAFLSGGLDSSTVVAAMTRSVATPVTFSFGFKREDLRYDIIEDDIKYARIVGRRFGVDYNEQFLEPAVMDLLPSLVYHMDEPVADPAIITSYLICRSARSRLKVLLSGMGGDEAFAGYPRHLAERIAGLYKLLPASITGPVVSRLPGSRPGRFNSLFRNIKKLDRSARLPGQDRYLGFGTYFSENEKAQLYSAHLRSETRDFDPYREHRRHFAKVAGENFVNQMLYIDLKTFLPCLNLAYTDKTSMAQSVEVRVPLLDHELVELSARMPARLKLKGLRRKYILKKAAEAWLPHEVVYRKKAGFSAPVRAWLARDLRDRVESLLSKENIARRGYFEYGKVRSLIDENLAGREDNSLKIFQLMMLELWHETFIDSRAHLAAIPAAPVHP